MEIVSDIILIAAALAATAYCIVLSRRLRRFTNLEQGVGGAIAVLSAQVDDMTKTLELAQVSAAGSAESLSQLTGKAEAAAGRLELLVASMHDLPEPSGPATDGPVSTKNADTGATPDQQPSATAAPAETGDGKTDEQQPLFHSSRNHMGTAAE